MTQLEVVTDNASRLMSLALAGTGSVPVISHFRIGDDFGFEPEPTETSVRSEVYVGSADQMTWEDLPDGTLSINIDLDDTVGGFNIGNIGIYLSDGSLLALVALPGAETKIATVEPNILGNYKSYNIQIKYRRMAEALDLNMIMPIASGVTVAYACKVATIGVLPNTPVYNNGTLGIGASLQASANGSISPIDGIPIAQFDRILVKDQTNPAHNGVYIVNQVGDGSNPYILVRAPDCNSILNIRNGLYTLIRFGTTWEGWGFAITGLSTFPRPVIGTDAINWTEFDKNVVPSFNNGLVQNLNGIGLQILNPVVTGPKPTVDQFGRITSMGSLLASDITGALQYNPSVYLANLAAVKALTTRPEFIQVAGRLTPGDGWEGYFYWVDGDLTTPDDALVVSPTAGPVGRYHRAMSQEIELGWWSPALDATVTDDTSAIQQWLTAASVTGKIAKGKNGIAKVTLPLSITESYTKIEGANLTLNYTGMGNCIEFVPSGGNYLEGISIQNFNITVNSNGAVGFAIKTNHSSYRDIVVTLAAPATSAIGFDLVGDEALDTGPDHNKWDNLRVIGLGSTQQGLRFYKVGPTFRAPSHNTFVGGCIEGCSVGVDISGHNNNFYSLSVTDCITAVQFDLAHECNIYGLSLNDDTTGVAFTGNSEANSVTGVHLDTVGTPFTDSGTNNSFYSVNGYLFGFDLTVNGDVTADNFITTGNLTMGGGGKQIFTSRSRIQAPDDGTLLFTNSAETAFLRIMLGGTSNLFPAIKRNSTAINFRLANDSGDADITAGAATLSGTLGGVAATFSGLVTANLGLTVTGAALSAAAILSSSSIKSSSATDGIGYATGAGGTQTQLTSKSTSVTLNKATGKITMHNASLNAATTVSFTLNNTAIAAGDVLIVNHVSGGTAGSYFINAQCGASAATINVRNISGGALGEAIVLAFAVIKGVTA